MSAESSSAPNNTKACAGTATRSGPRQFARRRVTQYVTVHVVGQGGASSATPQHTIGTLAHAILPGHNLEHTIDKEQAEVKRQDARQLPDTRRNLCQRDVWWAIRPLQEAANQHHTRARVRVASRTARAREAGRSAPSSTSTLGSPQKRLARRTSCVRAPARARRTRVRVHMHMLVRAHACACAHAYACASACALGLQSSANRMSSAQLSYSCALRPGARVKCGALLRRPAACPQQPHVQAL